MTIEAAKPVQPCVPQAEDFFRQYDVDTFRPEPGAHCGPKPRPNMISSDEMFAPPADQFAPPDLSHWGGTPAPERTAEEIFAPPTDPFAPPDLSSWGGTPAPSSTPSESCGCGGSCDGQCGAGCAGSCGGRCSSKRRAPAVQEWPPKDPDALDVEAEWARYYAEGGRRGGPRAVELAAAGPLGSSDSSVGPRIPPCPAREASAKRQRQLFCYEGKPSPLHGNQRCYRSYGTDTRGGQQCCYDESGRLDGEPSTAGTIDLVGPSAGIDAKGDCTHDVGRVHDHFFRDVCDYCELREGYFQLQCCLRWRLVPTIGRRNRGAHTHPGITDAELTRHYEACKAQVVKRNVEYCVRHGYSMSLPVWTRTSLCFACDPVGEFFDVVIPF